ncbi:MAG: metal-dependent phosphohydrolase HD sub domain-containing protein [Bacteroidetes bacterium]|nr:MAG: metal-dependent phosphohydrolase HD sub domain-containing protein [Bacteroidota bacterium]
MASAAKRKIFNDPVYGFITVPSELIFKLIDHRFFQRLRRIRQLGLTNLVYPGALHTRFHHAIGAMHLMHDAIEVIRSKGQEITPDEAEGALVAILLHDIGHGPFSHALESSIVHNITHEDLSAMIMDRLNEEFSGKLNLAIRIFRNQYKKKFLHQLVSSQLDMDRLDYLLRDSFFTGVSEGIVSSDRIVKMLNVVDDDLVVEDKGIYSIEKFIVARRLMYWQVYLHKTVLSAEHLLVNILRRAKQLAEKGETLFCTPALHEFLYNKHGKREFARKPELLETFASLDDYDIMSAVKVWVNHSDRILGKLCDGLVNRNLFAVELQKEPFKKEYLAQLQTKAQKKLKLKKDETKFFVFTGAVQNNAYSTDNIRIKILFKNGQVMDIAKAADLFNISVIAKPVKKYFLCYPKALR